MEVAQLSVGHRFQAVTPQMSGCTFMVIKANQQLSLDIKTLHDVRVDSKGMDYFETFGRSLITRNSIQTTQEKIKKFHTLHLFQNDHYTYKRIQLSQC